MSDSKGAYSPRVCSLSKRMPMSLHASYVHIWHTQSHHPQHSFMIYYICEGAACICASAPPHMPAYAVPTAACYCEHCNSGGHCARSRCAHQNVLRAERSCGLMPVSSGVPASAFTSAPIDGWLVVPAHVHASCNRMKAQTEAH